MKNYLVLFRDMRLADLTGSSAFPVLLIADETSLISSIIVVKSLLMSVRRSETRSAVLYLVMVRLTLHIPSKDILTFSHVPDQDLADPDLDQPASPSCRRPPSRTCPATVIARLDDSRPR